MYQTEPVFMKKALLAPMLALALAFSVGVARAQDDDDLITDRSAPIIKPGAWTELVAPPPSHTVVIKHDCSHLVATITVVETDGGNFAVTEQKAVGGAYNDPMPYKAHYFSNVSIRARSSTNKRLSGSLTGFS